MAGHRWRVRSALRLAFWNADDDPVDIDTVRQARTLLATLLRDNPDLTLPENRERFFDWLAKEDAMLKSNPVTCRLDEDIARRLSELAKRYSQPGLKLTQSDAVRMAIVVGLDAMDGKG